VLTWTILGAGAIAAAAAIGSVAVAVARVVAVFRALAVGAAALALIGGGIPALIIAGVIAAGIAIAVFWTEISTGAQKLWADLTGLFERGWAFLKGGWDAVASTASGIWDGIVSAATSAWSAITTAAQALWTSLAAIFQSGIGLLNGIWNAVTTAATAAWAGLVTAWQAVVDQIVGIASNIAGRIGGAFQLAIDTVTNAFQSLSSTVSGILSTIGGIIDSIAAKIASMVQALSALTGGGSAAAAPQGFAGGGYTGSGGVFSRPASCTAANMFSPPMWCGSPACWPSWRCCARPAICAGRWPIRLMPRGFSFRRAGRRHVAFAGVQPDAGFLCRWRPGRRWPEAVCIRSRCSSSRRSGAPVKTISGLHATPQRARELEKEARFDRCGRAGLPSRGSSGG
jgi:hypothetical protein